MDEVSALDYAEAPLLLVGIVDMTNKQQCSVLQESLGCMACMACRALSATALEVYILEAVDR